MANKKEETYAERLDRIAVQRELQQEAVDKVKAFEKAARDAEKARWTARYAKEQAERDALVQKRQDERDAQQKAAKDAREKAEAARIRSELRGAYTGSDVEFEAAYPELLKVYREREALRNLDERRAASARITGR